LQPQDLSNEYRTNVDKVDELGKSMPSNETRVDENDDQDQDEPDEDEQEEINFDQLLGDAAQSQADYEEDREDSIDDEEEVAIGDGLDYSLSYTKTANAALIQQPQPEQPGEKKQEPH